MVQPTQTVQNNPEVALVSHVEDSELQSLSFTVGDLVNILFTSLGNALLFLPSLMIHAISDWTSSSVQMDEKTGVPVALHDLLKIVEDKAKTTEGIYRISSSFDELNALTQQVSEGKVNGIKADMNAHLAACSVKKLLRDMPNAQKVFPAEIPNLEEIEEEQKLAAVKPLISALSPQKKAFLTHMLNHIDAVSRHSEVNKMPKSNLALTLMPNLIPQPTYSLETLAAQTKQNAFFMFLVENRTALDI